MPREATITFEQVAAAADAIKAAGNKPTLRAVREQIGSGSFATVQRHLAQWQGGQGRQAEAALTLPPALQRAILEFMGQEMATQRAGIEAALAEAQSVAADLAREGEQMAEEIVRLQSDLGAALEQGERLTGQLEQLTSERDRVSAEAADAIDAAKADAARERASAEDLRVELARATLRLEGMPRLEADLVAVRGDLADERGALAKATADLAGVRASLAAVQEIAAEAKGLRGALDAERQKRTDAERQHAACKASLDAAEQVIAKLEGVLDVVRAAGTQTPAAKPAPRGRKPAPTGI